VAGQNTTARLYALATQLFCNGLRDGQKIVKSVQGGLFIDARLFKKRTIATENRGRIIEGHDIVLAVLDPDFACVVKEISFQRIGVQKGRQIKKNAAVGKEAIARNL
jgi:hypothetical protein